MLLLCLPPLESSSTRASQSENHSQKRRMLGVFVKSIRRFVPELDFDSPGHGEKNADPSGSFSHTMR